MAFDLMADVNWLAVVLGGVAWFVLGAIWYIPPVMGRREAGVAATVTAMLAVATETTTASEGAVLGFLVGVGYALTAAAVTAIYDRKPDPFGWFWINGVFNVVGLTVVGLIIGALGG